MTDRPLRPGLALLALASGTFAVGTATYCFVGDLQSLSLELGISVPEAGQLVTAVVVTQALLSPALARVTVVWPSRWLLVAGMLALACANIGSALAANHALQLSARGLAGLAAALYAPTAFMAATFLLPEKERGRALAVVASGASLAFLVGMPSSTMLAAYFGWRATFWGAAAVAGISAALLCGCSTAFSSPVKRLAATSRPILSLLRDRRVAVQLLMTAAGFAATFTVVSYTGPVLASLMGLGPGGIGWFQLVLGLGGLVGVWVGGLMADHGATASGLRALFVLLALSLLALSCLSAWDPSPLLWVATAAAFLFGGAATFALVPLQKTRLLRLESDSRAVLVALNGSAMFLGQGIGTAVGGGVIEFAGAEQLGIVGAVLALAGASFTLNEDAVGGGRKADTAI